MSDAATGILTLLGLMIGTAFVTLFVFHVLLIPSEYKIREIIREELSEFHRRAIK